MKLIYISSALNEAYSAGRINKYAIFKGVLYYPNDMTFIEEDVLFENPLLFSELDLGIKQSMRLIL